MCNYNAYRALDRKSESYSVSSWGVCLANFRGTGTEGKRSEETYPRNRALMLKLEL